ncbi:hypothetical protein PIB30_090410 [Stylosanthes scabra]|uniref:Uncharacterized protein n=1 Tax=Stylosanthes scabra TaxID=79078 RepID=A0ABU6WSM2_9FABA|nr:hypothetical protein [Stylosanthes scabra]
MFPYCIKSTRLLHLFATLTTFTAKAFRSATSSSLGNRIGNCLCWDVMGDPLDVWKEPDDVYLPSRTSYRSKHRNDQHWMKEIPPLMPEKVGDHADVIVPVFDRLRAHLRDNERVTRLEVKSNGRRIWNMEEITAVHGKVLELLWTTSQPPGMTVRTVVGFMEKAGGSQLRPNAVVGGVVVHLVEEVDPRRLGPGWSGKSTKLQTRRTPSSSVRMSTSP